MGEETKNECGYTWGTALALLGGAAVGYWAGRSNGNCGCNNGCGCGPAVAPVAGGAYAAGNLGYLEGKVTGSYSSCARICLKSGLCYIAIGRLA